VQAQITNMLEELQEKSGLIYVFIAHGLSAVQHIGDSLAVMYVGRIIGITRWRELHENLLHLYTKAVLSTVAIADAVFGDEREQIIPQGEVPGPIDQPPACSFPILTVL